MPFASRHQLGLTTAYETASGSAGPIPSYWLWNAQVTKDVEVQGRDVTLSLAMNNILDEDYYFRGVDVSPTGRVPQPGRAVVPDRQHVLKGSTACFRVTPRSWLRECRGSCTKACSSRLTSRRRRASVSAI